MKVMTSHVYIYGGKGGNPPANVTWYDKNGVQIGGTGKEEQTLTRSNV